jgi:hypothetical protein
MSEIIKKVTEILNGKEKLDPLAILSKWKNIYYNISVHTTGVCPAYYPLRYEGNSKARSVVLGESMIYPFYWIYPEYDIVFDRLFGMHPREPHATRELRKSLYKPHQQAPLTKAIDKCKAVISAENKYTLFVDDKEDNDYIWGKNFDGKNLVEFIFWHFKTICEDPNSKFIVRPKKAAKEQTNKKVEVEIIHVPSRRIRYSSESELIYYEGTDDMYAWYINPAAYLRFERSNKGDFNHMDGRQGYYAHMLGRLPVHTAGGVWNSHGFYDSYIQPAIPFCDEFVGAQSAVQMVNKEAAHPFIIAASPDCKDCEGVGYTQWCSTCNNRPDQNCNCDKSAYSISTCRSCNGTKLQSINPGDWMIVPSDLMKDDLIKIINPDVAVNEFLVKHKDAIYENIKDSLHQQYIKEAQSGVAKEIDRDGERMWYKTCSDGMWYGLIEPILISILSLRNISKSNDTVSVNLPNYTFAPPTSFDLKTEFDLLEEYKEATDSQIPEYVKQSIVESYVDKVYGGNELMVKKSKFINYIDPYSVSTPADKTIAINNGVASIEQIRISDNLPMLLNRIVNKRGEKWFLNADFDMIEAEVNTLFTAMPVPQSPKETVTVKEVV